MASLQSLSQQAATGQRLCDQGHHLLGFIPNLEKSDLIPTQDFVFIGARFKLNQGLAAVPGDRFLKLSLAIQEVLSQKSTASAYQILRILGLMASVLQLVHWGRLHMRPIQLYLFHFWKPSKRQIQDQISLNDHLFHHLKWWLNRQNVMTEITLTTDASLQGGGGGYCGQEVAQGTWSQVQAKKISHINALEMSPWMETMKHFLIPITKEACPDQVRQHDSSQSSKQARRYKISQSLYSDMAPFKVGQEATMHDRCYTSSRSNESEGRFLVKTQDLAHRVDAPSKAVAGDFQDLGETVDRPVCSRPKSPSANILCLASEHGGLCARHIQSELGQFKCVCIRSNLSYSSSTETDGVSSMSGNSDCTIVAQTGMVHEASGSAGRYSHNTTDSRQSAAAGQRAQQNISSQPTNVVFDGMETVQPQGSSGNISERAQELVEASLREGTRKDYLSKYGRYSDWCDQKGLPPSRAPLNEILNFLAHLQEQGYSYSTVCGYRSMLSAFHEPVDGDSVGSHPLVTHLIKGVFNTNPPNKKLCPEWDVGLVLMYL